MKAPLDSLPETCRAELARQRLSGDFDKLVFGMPLLLVVRRVTHYNEFFVEPIVPFPSRQEAKHARQRLREFYAASFPGYNMKAVTIKTSSAGPGGFDYPVNIFLVSPDLAQYTETLFRVFHPDINYIQRNG